MEKGFGKIFGTEGEINDSASEKLFSLRKRQISLRKKISLEITKKIKHFDNEKFLYDKIFTQRNGRYVIPVKENAVSFISGIVHGKSSGKASVFIEPQEVVGLNNELDILFSDEKQEIYRILKEFSEQIKIAKSEIIANTNILQLLDFYNAAAGFSRKLNSAKPKIVSKPYHNIYILLLDPNTIKY